MFEKLFPQLAEIGVKPDMVDFQIKSYSSETQVNARNYGCSCFIIHDPAKRDKNHPRPEVAKDWVSRQIKARAEKIEKENNKARAERIAKNRELQNAVKQRIADEKKAAKSPKDD